MSNELAKMKRNAKVGSPDLGGIKRINAVCVSGPNKGRLYRAFERDGVAYWTVEDALAGIPAAVRSGMPGFDKSAFLVDEEEGGSDGQD